MKTTIDTAAANARHKYGQQMESYADFQESSHQQRAYRRALRRIWLRHHRAGAAGQSWGEFYFSYSI